MGPDVTPLGDLVTRASAWLALLAWLAGPLAACVGRRHRRWQAAARAVYSVGLGLFAVHVAAAFHVFYRWSHDVAFAETARQSAEATGVAAGSGLWLNYLFGVLWLLDALWWWRAGLDAYRRRPWPAAAALYGFFVFMAFNATVVFETGPVRWAGLAATLGLAAAALRALAAQSRPPSRPARNRK